LHPANKPNFRADEDLSDSNLAHDGAVMAVDIQLPVSDIDVISKEGRVWIKSVALEGFKLFI